MAQRITRRVVAVATLGLLAGFAAPAMAAPGDDCTGDYYVDQAFASGARWQLCWEHRNLEGIVYSQIYYTPPGGSPQKMLYEAKIAQIHVPYDDNGARFHDVTDYGIGGTNMDDLASSDCPGGTLLRHNGKDVVCQQFVDRDAAYRHGGRFARDQVLKLFSVSAVGAYNYIPEWRFHADGTLAPTVGASGRLQRFGTDSTYGWPISSGNTTGIAHIHNYHWRLDFEFDENDRSEVVEEIDHIRVGSTREIQVTALTAESNRSLDRDLRRSWRVRHASATNAAGRAISYHIEPSHHAHRHIGPSYEPWTNDEFYVTRYSSCENYATHNDNVGGCGDNLTDFVSGQTTFEEDLVVWYSITFHHLPTDEDEPNMHTHWDGFEIVPRDWTASNPLPEAPEITPPAPVTLLQGVPMTLALATLNPAGATLSFEADDLPSGLSINAASGEISGTPGPGTVGDHSPKVRVLGALSGKTGWLGDSIVIPISVESGIECADSIDNDADGMIDLADPGCSDATDTSERATGLPCDDGIDNDGDGRKDFDPITYANPGDSTTLPSGTGDPGCKSPAASREDPKCQDGLHNDGDGKMDYDAGLSANGVADPAGRDPQCSNRPARNSEAGDGSCALGSELALLLPALLWLRGRSRRARSEA